MNSSAGICEHALKFVPGTIDSSGSAITKLIASDCVAAKVLEPLLLELSADKAEELLIVMVPEQF